MKIKKLRKLAILSALALTCHSTHATVIMTLSPTPTGADFTITGSFDWENLNTIPAIFSTSNNFVVSDHPQVTFRSDGSQGTTSGFLVAIFGSDFSGDEISGSITAELPYSGDPFVGWGYSANAIIFPSDYVSGSEVSLSGTFTGPIFESNGGSLVPGEARRLNFSSGESIIFSTGRSIPEPSSLALVAAGMLLGVFRRRRA